ncbi:MAG: acyltransferase [Actinobacteria bacterium]|nr:acyltransferase [Actinomycetota bacterium]
MDETNNTRDVTSYLRGLGIIAVVITHYAGMYDPDFYDQYLNGYGYGFMSVFFILAGYGAFHSFEKRFAGGGGSYQVIWRYYLDRLLRIYPLFWAALTLTAILQPDLFPVRQMGVAGIIGVYAGSPFLTSPFWFISSIVMCYFLSPFLYLLRKKLGGRNYMFFNLALMAALLLVSWKYGEVIKKFHDITSITVPVPNETLFEGIFLGNVFLFSLGLMLPWLLGAYGERMKHSAVFIISGYSFLGLAILLRYDLNVLRKYQVLIATGYLSSIFFFTWSAIAQKPKLPLPGVIARMGRDSYSIYLFHTLMFQVLILVNLFNIRFPAGLMIALVFFLLLVWLCGYSERGGRWLRDRAWKAGSRRFGAAAPTAI